MTVTERMVPIACQLAGHVHAHDKTAIHHIIRRLTPHEAYALIVVLAAMIPQDQTPRELLAWTEHRPTRPRLVKLKPCGTHAAYWRHKNRGEPIDPHCLNAERDYQRVRKQHQRRKDIAA